MRNMKNRKKNIKKTPTGVPTGMKESKFVKRAGNSNYFEAILQIRGAPDEDIQKIVDFIQASECPIAKEIIHKNGVDFYLFSQKFAQKLSRWVKPRFSCKVTISSKLHTRDVRANKDLYRLTVLLEFLKYKIGEIIDYKGEKVKITSIGKKPVGKVVSTGKRIFID